MLSEFYLDSNSLTGTFPTQIGRLAKMSEFFDFNKNQFCSDLPTEVMRKKTSMVHATRCSTAHSL